jgi:HEAT repeat protein
MLGPVASRRKLEEVLAALRRVHEDPRSEASLAELRKSLADRRAHAVARAADLVAEFELHAFVPELLEAFDRFMAEPAADPGCPAKKAIAESLGKIGHDDPDVFLRGIRHVQWEPVYGGRVDTATELRGACGRGLVRIGYRDALTELAQLLADPESGVRAAAARALADRGLDDAIPLLRLRVLVGEKEAPVLSECFGAMMALASTKSVAFLSGLLDAPDGERAEAAALALGGSRVAEAFPILRSWAERCVSDRRRAALMAIALLRRGDAFDYLLSLVREADPPIAAEAIAALGLHRGDESLASRVRAAASERDEPRLSKALATVFG